MWVTPKQARLLTGLQAYQVDWLRKKHKVASSRWGHMWVYSLADIYRISERAKEVLAELVRFSERTESGKHFTEAFRYWQVLEECGWVKVEKPTHEATGIPFDQSYWRASVTPEGMHVAEFVADLQEAVDAG